ncbi:hypothetical protein JCM10207_006491 [Rhodosporidiobolus poonsookiae]
MNALRPTFLRPTSFSSPARLIASTTPRAVLLLRPAPRHTSSPLSRALSTVPTQFTPGGPDPPSLYPQPHEKPQRSATSEFYRALVPSMLHCLALGSIVYYALELVWMYLKREKEREELRKRVEELEGELETLRSGGKGVGKDGAAQGKSWWKLW